MLKKDISKLFRAGILSLTSITSCSTLENKIENKQEYEASQSQNNFNILLSKIKSHLSEYSLNKDYIIAPREYLNSHLIAIIIGEFKENTEDQRIRLAKAITPLLPISEYLTVPELDYFKSKKDLDNLTNILSHIRFGIWESDSKRYNEEEKNENFKKAKELYFAVKIGDKPELDDALLERIFIDKQKANEVFYDFYNYSKLINKRAKDIFIEEIKKVKFKRKSQVLIVDFLNLQLNNGYMEELERNNISFISIY